MPDVVEIYNIKTGRVLEVIDLEGRQCEKLECGGCVGCICDRAEKLGFGLREVS